VNTDDSEDSHGFVSLIEEVYDYILGYLGYSKANLQVVDGRNLCQVVCWLLLIFCEAPSSGAETS